jgi:hypothetical protein
MSISIQVENAKVLSQYRVGTNVKMKLEGLNLKFGVVEDFAYNAHGELLIGVRWFIEWRPGYEKPCEVTFVHSTKVSALN